MEHKILCSIPSSPIAADDHAVMASHEWQSRLDADWAEAKLRWREFGPRSFDPTRVLCELARV